MKRAPLLARLLIALYPRRWRARHGAELEELARDCAASRVRLLVDLARGMLDARCHPELVQDDGLAQAALRQAAGTMLMAAATVGVVAAGFVKLSEDLSFRGSAAAGDVTVAGTALAVAAGAVVLAGPLIATLRRGIAERRADVLARLLAVPAAGGLWLLSAVVLGRGAASWHPGALAHATFLAWCALSCGLAWGAAHAAGRALQLTHAPFAPALAGRGLWAIAAGGALALGGVALWGLLATARAGFGAAGLAGVPLGPVWLVLVLAMCAAVALLWHAARSAAVAAVTRA